MKPPKLSLIRYDTIYRPPSFRNESESIEAGIVDFIEKKFQEERIGQTDVFDRLKQENLILQNKIIHLEKQVRDLNEKIEKSPELSKLLSVAVNFNPDDFFTEEEIADIFRSLQDYKEGRFKSFKNVDELIKDLND